jgi:hypothetical protein
MLLLLALGKKFSRERGREKILYGKVLKSMLFNLACFAQRFLAILCSKQKNTLYEKYKPQ